jgi:hypothetical protein
MEGTKNASKTLAVKIEENRHLEDQGVDRDDNVVWICLTQDADKFWTP